MNAAERDKLLKRKQELETELDQIYFQLGIEDAQNWGKMDWKERSIKCINNRGIYSTTIEILKCLIGEWKYQRLDTDTRGRYVDMLSIALVGMVKDGYLGKVKIPNMNKGAYYGLLEWFGEDGTIKEEYANEGIRPIVRVINKKLLEAA